jgi:hypothetical protein
MVYSAGDCPICPGFGSVLFVRGAVSGRVFFLCPHCGVAWTSPPSPSALDEIGDPSEIAPDGLALPTREEIGSAGMEEWISSEGPYRDWAESLERYLRE